MGLLVSASNPCRSHGKASIAYWPAAGMEPTFAELQMALAAPKPDFDMIIDGDNN